MTKNDFCKIVNDMQAYEQRWDDINTFLSDRGISGYIHPNTTLVDDMILTLKEVFNDPNGLIEWFCINRHYGTASDESGSLKRIKTAGELYDCLMKEKK